MWQPKAESINMLKHVPKEEEKKIKPNKIKVINEKKQRNLCFINISDDWRIWFRIIKKYITCNEKLTKQEKKYMQQTISESKKFFFKLLLTWNQTRLNKEKRQERKETKEKVSWSSILLFNLRDNHEVEFMKTLERSRFYHLILFFIDKC